MDSDVQAQSPDKSDLKASFRKPANEVANRKYRRHSPIGQLNSSSSDGTPKRERSHSPVFPVKNHNKMPDDRRRKDDGSELERESNHYRSNRSSDSYRHSERSYGNSHDYRRHNDSGRYARHTEEEEKSYQWSSRSGRESRSDSRYDNPRHDNSSDRYRDNWKDAGKYTRDRSESWGHRHKDKERENTVSDHYRHNVKGSDKTRLEDYDRPVSGSRQNNLSRDDVKSGERERHRDRDARDDRKERKRSPDYKNDHSSNDSILGRDSNAQSKETDKNSNMEMGWKKEDAVQRRKHDGNELDKRKDKYIKEVDEELPHKNSTVSSYHERGWKEQQIDRTYTDEKSSFKKLKLGHSEFDEKPSSSSKQVAETAETITSKPLNSVSNQAESGNGVDAAKFAAMKAAELVNKNIVGGGYLSTDQKKKLLWGSKKSTAAEESGNRWDLQLFADRERQEKFNKLMGVKGEAALDHRSDNKSAEKQRELLNMDLEKQYTAGLRRRDGRTVGLGL